jgi:hypothetical protein
VTHSKDTIAFVVIAGAMAVAMSGCGEATKTTTKTNTLGMLALTSTSESSGATSKNEGSNSVSFSSQIQKYQQITHQQPGNLSAWENLVKAQLHEAGGEAYVTSSGVLTSKGRELFAQAARSWSSHLALHPPKPSPELAQLMLRVFGEEGLNRPSEEVRVLQIVVAAKPTNPAYYAQLARYAYLAHNTGLGDSASAKTISLVPTAHRQQLKRELEALKQRG